MKLLHCPKDRLIINMDQVAWVELRQDDSTVHFIDGRKLTLQVGKQEWEDTTFDS